MNTKSYLIFGMVVIILLVGVFFIFGQKEQEESQTIFRNGNTTEIRQATFANCQSLLNKTTDFEGKILFEECGKNCLGGCPNSGPDMCFYGIQDSNQCVVYLKSRNIGYGVFKNETFNDYDIGQTVKINGEISLYYSYYCEPLQVTNLGDQAPGFGHKVPECSYFVIGDTF